MFYAQSTSTVISGWDCFSKGGYNEDAYIKHAQSCILYNTILITLHNVDYLPGKVSWLKRHGLYIHTYTQLKGKRSKDASWPENIETVQIFPPEIFMLLFYLHLSHRGLVCFKSGLLWAQSQWFTLSPKAAEKGWFMMWQTHVYAKHSSLGHGIRDTIIYQKQNGSDVCVFITLTCAVVFL